MFYEFELGFEFRVLEFWGLVFCVLGWCTVMEWGPWCISNGSRHLNNLRCVHCKTTSTRKPGGLLLFSSFACAMAAAAAASAACAVDDAKP